MNKTTDRAARLGIAAESTADSAKIAADRCKLMGDTLRSVYENIPWYCRAWLSVSELWFWAGQKLFGCFQSKPPEPTGLVREDDVCDLFLPHSSIRCGKPVAKEFVGRDEAFRMCEGCAADLQVHPF